MSFTPTSDTAVPRPDLGIAVYETLSMAPTMGFIGMQIMPPFSVGAQTATYPVIPKEALFELLDDSRGSLGHYNRFEGRFEVGRYATQDRGLERVVDDRFLAMYRNLFDYEMTIANGAMDALLRAQEARIAGKIFNTSNFTAHNAATNWATVASAVPRNDIETARAALRALGIIPNCLILTYTGYTLLKENADVRTQVYQIFPDAAKSGTITLQHLLSYFDVPRILVAGALYNSAKSGQNAVLSDIWGSRYAMLCRVAESDRTDIIEPCIGRTFVWNGGGGPEPVVEQYREEGVRGDILRVRQDVSESFLASYDEDDTVKSEISKACGYLIDTTAAS